jgi:photosystem II stability/assembly factor-like uncharacterized protein
MTGIVMRSNFHVFISLVLIASAVVASQALSAECRGSSTNAQLIRKSSEAKQIHDKFRAITSEKQQEITALLRPYVREADREQGVEQRTFLHAIQFNGEKLGWALDWHGILHWTRDGGVTWMEKRLPIGVIGRIQEKLEEIAPGQPAAYKSMHFADDHFGLVVGPSGVIQSDDGGDTWRSLPTPSRMSSDAVFCGPDHGCWVGGAEPRVIFRRSTQQPNWWRQSTPAEGSIVALQFVDGSIGWAVSSRGEIIGTVDGGAHWTMLFADSGKRFWGLHFLNERLGWVVGADALIMRTGDGGRTWTVVNIPMPDFPRKELRFHAVKFADAQCGWVAGLHGIVLGTSDGGASWAAQRFEGVPANWLTVYSLAIGPGSVVWAAGNSGNIFVSVDGGKFWFPMHGYGLYLQDLFGKMVDRLGG